MRPNDPPPADRQPRRDRRAHHPRVPRARRRDGRRLLRGRRAGARTSALADRAVAIGAAPSAESYLSIGRIVDAARASGADAVHPGYGFLSENAGVRRGVRRRRPRASSGPAGASSSRWARRSRRARGRSRPGCRSCPARRPPPQDDDVAAGRPRRRIGFPLLVKASAGGGGKGMRVVCAIRRLDEALAAARHEAQARVRRRHALPRAAARAAAPRRDPGVRRRARARRAPVRARLLRPAAPPEDHRGEPVAGDRRRACARRMGEAAVALARRIGYTQRRHDRVPRGGHGDEARVLLPRDEHAAAGGAPGHRAVTGVDLVHAQLRVASGEPLPWTPGAAGAARPRDRVPDLRRGSRQRLPAAGRAAGALPRAAGPRASASTAASSRASEIGIYYDPMIAKLIAWGETREMARRRLVAALRRYPDPRHPHQHPVPDPRARASAASATATIDTGVPRPTRGAALCAVDRRPRLRRGAAPRPPHDGAPRGRLPAGPRGPSPGRSVGPLTRVASVENRHLHRAARRTERAPRDASRPADERVRVGRRRPRCALATRRAEAGLPRARWPARPPGVRRRSRRPPAGVRGRRGVRPRRGRRVGAAAPRRAARLPTSWPRRCPPGSRPSSSKPDRRSARATSCVKLEAMKMELAVRAPRDGTSSASPAGWANSCSRASASWNWHERARRAGALRVRDRRGRSARRPAERARAGRRRPTRSRSSICSSAAGLPAIEVTAFVSPQVGAADGRRRRRRSRASRGVRGRRTRRSCRTWRASSARSRPASTRSRSSPPRPRRSAARTSTRGSTSRSRPIAAVVETARAAGIRVRGYLSTCFGCPYEGEVPPARVAELAGRLLSDGRLRSRAERHDWRRASRPGAVGARGGPRAGCRSLAWRCTSTTRAGPASPTC